MALFRFSKSENSIVRIEETTLQNEGIVERDIQEALRKELTAIDENLLVVSPEYSSWEGSHRRVDLLCIEKQAGEDGSYRLVVIELKRASDAHLELQAIRYSAMVSLLQFEDVVTAYENYLRKYENRRLESNEAFLELIQLLHVEGDFVRINPLVRTILVASEFDPEVTTSVLYLLSLIHI
mgnify:CR=1 FL=1